MHSYSIYFFQLILMCANIVLEIYVLVVMENIKEKKRYMKVITLHL